jgi:type VI secretion system FHA domain protein
MLPLVIYTEDPDAPDGERRYVFKHSPVRIGRSPMNDLVLSQGFVSQLHGIVRFDERDTMFVDLGSTNGTEIDGQRAARNVPVPVDENARVAIGPIRMRFAREDASPVERTRVTQFQQVASLAPAETEEVTALEPAPPQLGMDRRPRGTPAPQPQAASAPPRAGPPMFGTLADLAVEGPSLGTDISPMTDIASRMGPAKSPTERAAEAAPPSAVPLTSTVDAAARELLNQFVKSYVPHAPGLDSKKELRAFLERLADVLEAFGNAFVELRRGHDQFGRQMAVPTASEVTPLHRSESNRDVLKYVLDWKQGPDRVQQLMGGFVDVMIHQIALLSGIQQGVRGLLLKLSPEELERRVKERQGGGLLAKLGLNRSDALWQAFLERHAELLEDDQEMTKALFGPEFARTYVAIVGERAKKGSEEEEGGPIGATPARGHARR